MEYLHFNKKSHRRRKSKTKSRRRKTRSKSRKPRRKSRSKSRKPRRKTRSKSRRRKSRSKSRRRKSRSRKRKSKSRRLRRKSKSRKRKSKTKARRRKSKVIDNFYDLDSRLRLMQEIRKDLLPIANRKYGSQCVNNSSTAQKHLKLVELLGVGGFGNVYNACAPRPCTKNSKKFSLKLMKLDNESINKKYDKFHMDWNEYNMFKTYINDIIISGRGPNLPLFIDDFVCDKCIFQKRNDNIFVGGKYTKFETPCITIASEVAYSDLNDFLKKMENTKNLNSNSNIFILQSLLFQIMAGLYSLQKEFQIVNNDLKSGNVLVYKVKAGGYFNYNIDGIDYYIPNFGWMFVINDFGLSTCYWPFTNFNGPIENSIYNQPPNFISLGTRPGFVKNGLFQPINTRISHQIRAIKVLQLKNKGKDVKPIYDYRLEVSKPQKVFWDKNNKRSTIVSKAGTIFKNAKKSAIYDPEIHLNKSEIKMLKDLDITTTPFDLDFYNNSSVIPPIQFANDTQDAIRIFLGGGQMSVSNYHKPYPAIKKVMHNYLNDYDSGLREQVNINVSYPQEASLCSAEHFIYDFFGPGHTPKPKSDIFFMNDKITDIVASYRL